MKLLTIFAFAIISSHSSYAQERQSTPEHIESKVEFDAEFPGGTAAWSRFLIRTLDPNVPINNGAPKGTYTVHFRFVVEKDGSLSNFQFLRNEGFGMEDEVKRVLLKSGKWQPASQSGRNVNAIRIQSISFNVEDENIDLRTALDNYTISKEQNKVYVKVRKMDADEIQLTPSDGKITYLGDNVYQFDDVKLDRVFVSIHNIKKNKKIDGFSLAVLKDKSIATQFPKFSF